MFYLNKGLNCFSLFFDFMGFYFNNGINRQNDKEHTIYFHVLFKALKLFPVVGIIRLLPFWDFIRQQCQVHTNSSGHMALFCRVSSVSLFPICKFPVFKDWIVKSIGWIKFRDIPRVALMRVRSINVAVISNTFFYILKFLCIDERLNVLFDSLSSIELIIHGCLFRSLYSIEYICSDELFMGQWPLRVIDILENWFHRTKYTASDNKIARIAFSRLVFCTRYVS